MKLKDARDNYYFFSGKTSDIVRQLALAGIAIVWFFKFDAGHGDYKIPAPLKLPVELIVIGLILDLLQYAIATGIWGIYQRQKELTKIGEDTSFEAPKQLNHPTIVLFIAKVSCVAIAFVLLLRFIYQTVL